MNDPILKSVTVPLTALDAFKLFTSDIDTWWPKAKFGVTRSKAKLHFPTHQDGAITETGEDGETVIWGRIIAYDPGNYLAFSWHPGRPDSEATFVQISFTETEAGTRCNLAHGGFDVLGDTADAVSTSYLHGWDLVLGCFQSAGKAPMMSIL